jgi:hypothetical protein
MHDNENLTIQIFSIQEKKVETTSKEEKGGKHPTDPL